MLPSTVQTKCSIQIQVLKPKLNFQWFKLWCSETKRRPGQKLNMAPLSLQLSHILPVDLFISQSHFFVVTLVIFYLFSIWRPKNTILAPQGRRPPLLSPALPHWVQTKFRFNILKNKNYKTIQCYFTIVHDRINKVKLPNS